MNKKIEVQFKFKLHGETVCDSLEAVDTAIMLDPASLGSRDRESILFVIEESISELIGRYMTYGEDFDIVNEAQVFDTIAKLEA